MYGTTGSDPIHTVFPRNSYPTYRHFYPQFVHAHSEQ